MSQFFRVDRRLWRVVCNLGSDEALAYLTIACGADANMMTGWSAKAIRKSEPTSGVPLGGLQKSPFAGFYQPNIYMNYMH